MEFYCKRSGGGGGGDGGRAIHEHLFVQLFVWRRVGVVFLLETSQTKACGDSLCRIFSRIFFIYNERGKTLLVYYLQRVGYPSPPKPSMAPSMQVCFC